MKQKLDEYKDSIIQLIKNKKNTKKYQNILKKITVNKEGYL